MSTAPTPLREALPTVVHGRVQAPGQPIAWPDVLQAMPEDETRSYAFRRVRDAGFSAVSFGLKTNARWRRAREATADALTRTEDWLELTHPRRAADRAALQAVRRRLEWELWP